ncbi:MAG: hypothetical protein SOV61_02605 [Lachnospiraceae bacterium]|nr:hypothetical protein [Lachnospiraceae bacterium]
MKKLVKKMYFWMQNHYFTFRILVVLKEMGISRKINSILFWPNNENEICETTEAMKRSAEFFEANKEKLDKVMRLLADEKSRKVLEGVIKY